MNDDLDEFNAKVSVVSTDEDFDFDFEEADLAPLECTGPVGTPKDINAQMWSVSKADFFPCESAVETLTSGQYLVRYCDSRGFFFTKKKVKYN